MSAIAVPINVVCPCCHRSERWTASEHIVELEGGQRQPSRHPHLQAWHTLKRSLAGEIGRVVGACTACGQPLVTDTTTAPLHQWTFTLNDGDYVVASDISGPNGVVAPEQFHGQMMDTFTKKKSSKPARRHSV